jgi:hypothetical protein
VDTVAIAPVQQKTRLPPHESNGASACFSMLSFIAVWVVRLARVCCNSWCNSYAIDGFVNSKSGSFQAFHLEKKLNQNAELVLLGRFPWILMPTHL